MSEEVCCEHIDGSNVGSGEDDLSTLCKALGHPIRVKILKVLIEKGVCISGDLSEILPVSASTVSEHLRILKVAGLVKGSIDGPRRNYCVNIEVLNALKNLIQNL